MSMNTNTANPVVTLLEDIVKGLVDNETAVTIDVVEGEKTITATIKTDKTDTGKVIGRRGRIISAIRNIMSAVAAKHSKRINVSVVD